MNSILLKVVLLLASMGDLRSSLYLARSQDSSRTVVTNGQTLERMEQIKHAIRKTFATNSADISREASSVCSDACAELPDRRETVRVLNDSRVNASCLGIGHLMVKHCSCPWFHQRAVALVGLIRLLHLFICLPWRFSSPDLLTKVHSFQRNRICNTWSC